MAKEYLGANAVEDLFDIIDENYISKEDFENKEKAIASAVSVGSVLIAQCLLKIVEAIMASKGAEGGDTVNDTLIASDSEVAEILNKYFNEITLSKEHSGDSGITENLIATDDETNDVLDNYFH